MLNPSTADAVTDDPTIRRCLGFAHRDGYPALEVVNLYALRATDPRELGRHPDPVGPENVAHLDAAAARAGAVVAAWGAWSGREPMARVADAMLPEAALLCLGVTRSGAPRHPLYVRGDQPLVPWP